ncbi:DUF397 domain-containing protein [Streptomyces sp. ISL-11]|uniref:DUF397 domain-containing protein n=1 Tax=Streptomyces sp. ISL-11 TaxID=2819174 RepID=UPI001BE6A063|nr:DUF397 domain-containing protein [Streptomyces sp. ISL-11]MBT2385465.1 DUF397 domain-containing protein [Streptomyces sp. ISL-11]
MRSTLDLTAATWHKSSYSNGGDANCVEVADNIPGVVPVRDSKSLHRPTLVFSARAWSTFITAAKDGYCP